MMEWKHIQPVLLSVMGITLGWALKEASDFFRGTAEVRRSNSQGLYTLVCLHAAMRNIQHLLEMVKDAAGNWETFESLRSHYAARYVSITDTFGKDMTATIQNVASYDPWEAVRLSAVYDGYIKFGKISLKATQQLGIDSYIKGLSALEVTHEESIKQLRKTIIKQAWRCGIVQYVRTNRELSQRDSNFAGDSTVTKLFQPELEKMVAAIHKRHDESIKSDDIPSVK